jgi:hypothetical protein
VISALFDADDVEAAACRFSALFAVREITARHS